MADQPGGHDLRAIYRRYNACCNAHEFDRLGEFVAPRLRVDGEERTLQEYADGLAAAVDAFPDLRWELRHLLVDAPWVAAHFLDTGTHRGTFHGVPATGRTVTAQEFAVYRFEAGRIVEVWVTADDLGRLRRLGASPAPAPERHALG
ncbi:ester cyclase [Kineococcus glutinatus]|uniref:Ester cyclase n=1 Tax=Kineococcus glutinatus TaxID=1070872 RepID=A0ABP9I9V5_9ACTN